MSYRPTVLVDFDGVIHAYSRGWSDGTVYDESLPGALAALETLEANGYDVVIFSTRPAHQITDAFERWGWGWPHRAVRHITNVKEPAVALIDDRAIRFVDWVSALTELTERYPVRRA